MNAGKWKVVAIFIVAFALRMWRLDAQSLWWDEMATVIRTVGRLSESLDSTLRANQLPLYYLLLRPWMALHYGAFWLRYASVWWGVLTVALTFRLAARLAGQRVAAGAAAILTMLPLHIRYCQEGRMYSLLGALAVVSYLQLMHVVHHPRDGLRWLAYGAVLLMAVYTHPFGVFLLLAHAVPFLVNRRRRPELAFRWLIVAGLNCLALLAWVALFIRGGFSLGAHGWIAKVRWYEPLLTLYSFGLGSTADPAGWWNWMTYGVLLIASAWGGRRLLRSGHTPLVTGSLLCWLFLPIFIMWLPSLRVLRVTRGSIYMDRYVTWLLPGFAVLLAWGWESWRLRHTWAWGIAALYLVTLVLSLGTYYTDLDHARTDWRSAVAHINAVAGEDAVLVRRTGQLLPLWYYPPSEVVTVVAAPDSPADAHLDDWLEMSSPPRELWLITNVHNIDPHGFPEDRNRALDEGASFDGLKSHFDRRYPVLHRIQFPGIILSCYSPVEEANGL